MNNILKFILFAFTVSSCNLSILKMSLKSDTVENKTIPSDFGSDSTILICVINGEKNYDRIIKKKVDDIYHGQVEFVHKDSLDLEKYSDSINFRYIFDSSIMINNTVAHKMSSSGELEQMGVKNKIYHFYLLDKRNYNRGNTQNGYDKYESKIRSSAYDRLIQGYMTNLEKQRLLNKK